MSIHFGRMRRFCDRIVYASSSFKALPSSFGNRLTANANYDQRFKNQVNRDMLAMLLVTEGIYIVQEVSSFLSHRLLAPHFVHSNS